jgi:hypothetical protein
MGGQPPFGRRQPFNVLQDGPVEGAVQLGLDLFEIQSAGAVRVPSKSKSTASIR